MRKLLPLVTIAALTAGTAPAASSAVAADRSPAARDAGASSSAIAARRRRRVCDRNYRGRCLRPNVSDYDCAGGSGNGPYYVRGPFTVVGDDHYGLDSDGDGVACES